MVDPGHSAITTELDRPGDCLLVSFGGVNQGSGMPPFEFARMTAELPCKLALVRDVEQRWYQGELPGIGPGMAALADTLRRLRRETGVARLACIGNSMGGYAALAVGSLAGADHVVALAPQTFISYSLRLRHLDRRWSAQISAARRVPSADPATWDLRRMLAAPGYGQAEIHAGRDSRLDRIHAGRLAELPRTTVQLHPGGHDLVKRMRDRGALGALLERMVRT